MPRIRHLLAGKNNILGTALLTAPDGGGNSDWQAVHLHQDRMYKHNIVCINYTMYDVRRDDDIIHPGTAHCNVMVLNPVTSSSEHPFWYARVLGIFHANVIYTGEGVNDFLPRRLEFMWVRWYQLEDVPAGWTFGCLDRVKFPHIMQEDSFGFIDPGDILRSSHIVPAFSRGRVHADETGISHLARDAHDWKSYYIMRCVSVRSG